MEQFTSLTVIDFCIHTGIAEEELQEIVGLGIIQPIETANEWLFDDHAVIIVRRAVRLYHELEIDWPGIAMAMSLMEQNERLQRENEMLRLQLKRFIG
ncbi:MULTISPECIES: chaperone modulator CbpM [Providencia]|uniref:chaperone modulator CbpM n=1 Tax=Providencia TaxID=586 RepID=UPI001B36826C|nr:MULTISPECIES: chaperone modulator CbpM [Providencia]MBQ0366634.1 chaperone-modulator protein CbpM [Providencia rettgeri]MDK7744700.1 chaperone modulator CbpM [Providencia rettgeri]MDK7759362.1 chaperone modulator CbpM [Providencia rettgeri]